MSSVATTSAGTTTFMRSAALMHCSRMSFRMGLIRCLRSASAGGGEGETERGRGREGIGREGGGREEYMHGERDSYMYGGRRGDEGWREEGGVRTKFFAITILYYASILPPLQGVHWPGRPCKLQHHSHMHGWSSTGD